MFVLFFFLLPESLELRTSFDTLYLPKISSVQSESEYQLMNSNLPITLPINYQEVEPALRVRRPRERFPLRCQRCGKEYKYRYTFLRHTQYECGREPKIQCPYCSVRTKQRGHIYRHIRRSHQGKKVYAIDFNWGFTEKYSVDCSYIFFFTIIIICFFSNLPLNFSSFFVSIRTFFNFQYRCWSYLIVTIRIWRDTKNQVIQIRRMYEICVSVFWLFIQKNK